jgi:acetate CoA/acetoacetate CoA-transferase alpha subunit
VINVDGRDFLLEKPLAADFALVAARSSDYVGNLVYSLTARNFNPMMAMAATTVLAEPGEVVPLGVLPPDVIHTPGVLIDYLIERPRL